MRGDVIIDVVCAVIEHEGRILATKRGEGMHLAGKWEFPGGKLYTGEGEEQALVREIREELQIEVLPLRKLPDVVHTYPGKSVRLIPFVCRFVSGEITLLEHSEFRWLLYEELSSLDWADADRPVVRTLLRFC